MSNNSTNTTVLTFDQLPLQPVDDLSFMGVTFSDTPIEPIVIDFKDAAAFVKDSLEGNAAGILTQDFDALVSDLEFGVALNTLATLKPGFTVELFDDSTLVNTIPVDTSSLPSLTEGLLSLFDSDIPNDIDIPIDQIDRVVIDFNDAAALPFGQISFEQNDDTIITTIDNQPLAVLTDVPFGDIKEAYFLF
ncbi:MAG: hypothetical protein F6K53_42205 [Moorea sp. SIO4A1]|uniref:hypothetical protein n=1 Tax=Moorena sp. SIO4A1 TaxID=2607835 RepID=UPI00144CCD6B|nr:hypothetical protein [Moorena sp. SIO4A1]NEQ63569.1 hypothetical protein [Moorena sp. SIO4A1]